MHGSLIYRIGRTAPWPKSGFRRAIATSVPIVAQADPPFAAAGDIIDTFVILSRRMKSRASVARIKF
jgi:hypothetical protein